MKRSFVFALAVLLLATLAVSAEEQKLPNWIKKGNNGLLYVFPDHFVINSDEDGARFNPDHGNIHATLEPEMIFKKIELPPARFGLEKEWLEDAYHHPDSVITLSSKSSWQLFLSGAAPRYLRADSMFLKTRLAKDSRPFFLINIVPFFLETDSVLQATFRSSDSVFEIAQNTNTTRGPSFGLIYFIFMLLSAALLAGLSLRADIRENDSAGIKSWMLSILAAIIAVFAPAAPLAVAEPNWLEFCLLIPAFTAALAGAIIFKSTIQNHEGSLKISVKLTLCSISFYIGYAALLTKSLLSSLIIAGIAAIIFLISWRFRNKPAK